MRFNQYAAAGWRYLVRCSGNDTDGFNQDLLGTGNLDEIDLRIRNGAVVTNADDTGERTIELDDDAEIVNRGIDQLGRCGRDRIRQ